MEKKKIYLFLFMALFAFVNMQAASINVAPEGTPSASYTSGWNNLNAINNGVVGYGSTAGTPNSLPNSETWGCWSGNHPDSQYLIYEWTDAHTFCKSTVYFWTDVAFERIGSAGEGVDLPSSWLIQYWDDATEDWADVTPIGEYPLHLFEPNTVEFEPVTTTKLRLFLYASANENGVFGALGVTEWEAYAEVSDEEFAAIAEMQDAYDQITDELVLGKNDSFSDIWDDLNLVSELPGLENVIITWTSSNPDVISEEGVVTPGDGAETVILTVTFSHPGSERTMQKTYSVLILPDMGLQTLIAKWQFTADNLSFENNQIVVRSDDDPFVDQDMYYSGTLKNGASIRTIGAGDNMFNVLDLGTANGYMDMGVEIGKQIYNLTEYTVGGYFFVPEETTDYTNYGNFLYCFANTEGSGGSYMFGRPTGVEHEIVKSGGAVQDVFMDHKYYEDNFIKYLGTWHHFVYTQIGQTGTIYIDGQVAGQNTNMTTLPVDLRIDGRDGTLYNWLGRACFSSDTYLKALIYDFRLYSVGMSEYDLNELLQIQETLVALKSAYNANPDVVDPRLGEAYDALDMNFQIEDGLSLPSVSELHEEVIILWESSDETVLNKALEFTPPLYDAKIKLTATLVLNGKIMKKDAWFTVEAADEAPFTDDLLVHFDFSQVEEDGRVVVDQAEQQFRAKVVNQASIQTIVTDEGPINVLELENGTGHLDMGARMGQVFNGATEYSLSAYFWIDEAYQSIGNYGNFLWTISSDQAAGSSTCYNILILRDMRVETRGWGVAGSIVNESNNFYPEGQQNAPKGVWKHVTYTQSADSIASFYVDGVLTNQVICNNILGINGKTDGLAGTPYNWLGRACYANDVYLRQSKIADFRVYGKALTVEEIESKMNVSRTLELLTSATTGIDKLQKPESPYLVRATNGQLKIDGLVGGESISMYDVMGRRYDIGAEGKDLLQIPTGIYIVKINDYATKIMVK